MLILLHSSDGSKITFLYKERVEHVHNFETMASHYTVKFL